MALTCWSSRLMTRCCSAPASATPATGNRSQAGIPQATRRAPARLRSTHWGISGAHRACSLGRWMRPTGSPERCCTPPQPFASVSTFFWMTPAKISPTKAGRWITCRSASPRNLHCRNRRRNLRHNQHRNLHHRNHHHHNSRRVQEGELKMSWLTSK